MQTLRDEIRAFIVENFLFGQDDKGLRNDESFLEGGIIDSTGVLELVGFLESHYLIAVEDQELVPANLDSVERLVQFLERKLLARETHVAG